MGADSIRVDPRRFPIPRPTGSGTTTPLERKLLSTIESGGPIPFAAFMESALYDRAHGYYTRAVPGEGADYRTAPSLTPWFGRLVARAFGQQWAALGRPAAFTVVEAGAGGGDLALAALGAATGPFRDALRWRFVERSAPVRNLQRQRLGAGAALEWVADLGEGDPVEGCVLANEVLDNMPVHVFELTADGLQEVWVATGEGRLRERLGPPSDEAAAALAARALPHLEEGDRLEVRPGIDPWCRQAAGALRRGSLMVVDYGDVAPALWLRRPAGSLVTYRDDRMGDDPLAAPGLADVTAHVDFTHLGRAAEAAGFEPGTVRTQRELLGSLGLGEVVSRLRDDERTARAEGRHADALGALGERSRLEAIAARGGLGDLLVFTAVRR